jgi:hypothetical protein
VARVESFWRALGARVVRRDPAVHDVEVAWMSHVPHVLAFAFARSLAEAPASAREVAGPGFRDFTRIARSDAELWSEILVANRKALGGPLARVGRHLAELGRALEADDGEAVERLLAEARAALDGAEGARGREREDMQGVQDIQELDAARHESRPIRGRNPGNPGRPRAHDVRPRRPRQETENSS